MDYDLLVKGALVFDGTGEPPRAVDVGVRGDVVVDVGASLPVEQSREVVDGAGRWLMPGLWDIHTHLDLEVEVDPGLTEVVRHGTTTAVVANCSLGLPFGRQNRDGHDPVVSCFARVENIPKPVLSRIAETISWDSPKSYLAHLEAMPLGANLITMIPHSMLRIEAMGIERALSAEASPEELQTMTSILDGALQEGYAGFSTDALPFHYMSNDPHRKVRIPAHHGGYRELRRLTDVVRKHGRVWQATPDKDHPLNVIRSFMLTSGRLFGRPLKVTAVAALDVVTNRFLGRLGLMLSRIFNSSLVKGHFRLQALAAPFRVYADGPITPLAEELPALRELNEIDLEDRAGRLALLNDPAYIQRFRAMWFSGKRGLSLARLKRWLNIMDESFSRDLVDMVMTERPVPVWKGETLQQVYDRLRQWQATKEGARCDEEREVFESFAEPVGDDCDFIVHLLKRFDTDLRWHVLAANDDEGRIARVLFDRQMLPGFNDSGAHLTNMAFYDANLRGLQLAQRRSVEDVSYLVSRLTRVPAAFWGVTHAGIIAPGFRADMILVDPEALEAYDAEGQMIFTYRDAFEAEQLLNRSDGVVDRVWIAGVAAWQGNQPSPDLGQRRLGQPFRIRGAGATPDCVPSTVD